MNCEEIQSKLSEYVENLSDPEIRAGISNHLSGCDRCRAEANEITQTIQLVRALPEMEPPAGFVTRIMVQVREPVTKLHFWQRFFFPFHIKLPLHAAAVILISILAVYLYHKEPQQKQIGEAESSRLKQDERNDRGSLEFPANVSGQKKNEVLEKKRGPRASFSAPPSDTTGRTPERKKEEARSFRPGVTPAVPLGQLQGKASLPSETSTGQGLPGSAAELRDKLVPIPVPSEGSRDAKSSVGAEAAATEEKKETTTPATEREITSENALDQLAAPQRGLAPKSLRTKEGPADYELFVRLRSTTSENKTSAEALASRQLKTAHPSPLTPAQKSELDIAGQRARDTQEAQTLWLSIPRDQWIPFKTDLAPLGQIESESAADLQPNNAVSKSSAPLRVKVTILPPVSAPSAPGLR